MKKLHFILSISSLIIFAACQKDVTTTPNRSGTGDQLYKFVVRDSNNLIINQVLFFYDPNSRLSAIETPRINYFPPYEKLIFVDSFYRDNAGKTIKHVVRIKDSLTQIFQPLYYVSTINYIANTDKVSFVKLNNFDNVGNTLNRDSSVFSYSADGQVKEINLYQDSANAYTFYQKYQYAYDAFGNMLEQRIYKPSWNNYTDTFPIHKQTISQFDNSKKYVHDFSFIDMWLKGRTTLYMDYQKSMYKKYDEINYNNNGADPQLFNITTVYNSTNNRPDSCAWIPRVSAGVKKIGIKFYYQ